MTNLSPKSMHHLFKCDNGGCFFQYLPLLPPMLSTLHPPLVFPPKTTLFLFSPHFLHVLPLFHVLHTMIGESMHKALNFNKSALICPLYSTSHALTPSCDLPCTLRGIVIIVMSCCDIEHLRSQCRNVLRL